MSQAHRAKVKTTSPITVFLIGMHMRQIWKVHRWLPVARAMPRMLKELSDKPELGFLGGEFWFGRTSIMVQYWQSHEKLYDYARSRDSSHLPAWQYFNKHLFATNAVGLWHESYSILPEAADGLYINMPTFGLGKALKAAAEAPKPSPVPTQRMPW